jgi:hypothetical protein
MRMQGMRLARCKQTEIEAILETGGTTRPGMLIYFCRGSVKHSSCFSLRLCMPSGASPVLPSSPPSPSLASPPPPARTPHFGVV